MLKFLTRFEKFWTLIIEFIIRLLFNKRWEISKATSVHYGLAMHARYLIKLLVISHLYYNFFISLSVICTKGQLVAIL